MSYSQGLAGKPRNRSKANTRCPRCQGELVRERRRMVDRLHSLFRPVIRYRCIAFSCQWEGNMASRKGDAAIAAVSGNVLGDCVAEQDATVVPVSFVVHMVLVVVGVVFVIVYSTSDQSSWFAESAQAFSALFLSAPEPSIPSVDAR